MKTAILLLFLGIFIVFQHNQLICHAESSAPKLEVHAKLGIKWDAGKDDISALFHSKVRKPTLKEKENNENIFTTGKSGDTLSYVVERVSIYEKKFTLYIMTFKEKVTAIAATTEAKDSHEYSNIVEKINEDIGEYKSQITTSPKILSFFYESKRTFWKSKDSFLTLTHTKTPFKNTIRLWTGKRD